MNYEPLYIITTQHLGILNGTQVIARLTAPSCHFGPPWPATSGPLGLETSPLAKSPRRPTRPGETEEVVRLEKQGDGSSIDLMA
eukprot:s766_g13.t1